LNANFASFHWAQSDISKELSRGRCSQVQTSSVNISILFSQGIGIDNLESFIKSKLADSLMKKLVLDIGLTLDSEIGLLELNNQ